MSQLWWNWPPKTFGRRTHIEAGLEPHHQAGGCEEEEESHVAAIVMFIMRQSCGKDPGPTAGFHRKTTVCHIPFYIFTTTEVKRFIIHWDLIFIMHILHEKRRCSLISWVLAFIFVYIFSNLYFSNAVDCLYASSFELQTFISTSVVDQLKCMFKMQKNKIFYFFLKQRIGRLRHPETSNKALFLDLKYILLIRFYYFLLSKL